MLEELLIAFQIDIFSMLNVSASDTHVQRFSKTINQSLKNYIHSSDYQKLTGYRQDPHGFRMDITFGMTHVFKNFTNHDHPKALYQLTFFKRLSNLKALKC